MLHPLRIEKTDVLQLAMDEIRGIMRRGGKDPDEPDLCCCRI